MSRMLNPTPLQVAAAPGPTPAAPGGYATLTKDRVQRLARAMPDCQSAILLLLTWQATIHEKMKRGHNAGRTVGSLSGAQLAAMSGRPLRTVRHALRQLAGHGAVTKHSVPAGTKNCYRLPFLHPAGEAPGASPSAS